VASLRVLLVEDNDTDAIVAEAAVRKAGNGSTRVLRADTLAKALDLVRSTDVNLVLLDLNLHDSSGLDTLKRMRTATRCPIIVITVENRPGLDEEALYYGAFEILHKGMLTLDTIVRLLRLADGQRRVQRSFEDIERRYHQLIEVSPDAIFVQSDWRIILVNPAMLQLFRAERPEQLLGRNVLELIAPGSLELVQARVRWMFEKPQRVPLAEIEFRRTDGTSFIAEVSSASFMYDGHPAVQVVARDISDRKVAEAALSRAHLRLELALEANRVCTWDFDLESGEVVLSESWAEIIDEPPGETRTTFRALAALVHADDVDSLHQILTDVVKGLRDNYSVEHRVRSKAGEWLWIVSRGKVVERDQHGRALRMLGTNLDISAHKRAEEQLRDSEARFRSLTALSSDWYWEKDEELRFTYVSPGFSECTGSNPDTILGHQRWEFDDDAQAVESSLAYRAALDARQPFRDFEQIRFCDDGSRQFIASSGEPVFHADGSFRGYRGVSSNITVRKLAEKRLAYLAQFDAVTGLPNRDLMQEKLEYAILQSQRHGRSAGALLVNLDRFKLVNDTLGHRAGDALLVQMGRRLQECIRQDDTLGRLAGDEFAVVIADMAQFDDAAIVAQKILDSFAVPFNLGGQEIYLTASIGLAMHPVDGNDADALLNCADVAMHRVKESSGNAFCFYAREMNVRATAKLQLNSDLRRAVDRGEFRLHYQPKVDLATGNLVGMEALLRWQHPERGMIAPNNFIPSLEDTGLIVAVGDWVVEEACRQLRDWENQGRVLVPIAVNLSARQFRRHDLDRVICGIVAAQGLQTGILELEITESSLMEDPADAIRQLHALREAGLKISVDDFGTGYSSLAYLTRLPLSTLKIDRTFVNAAISETKSAAIVRMVIDMARNMDFNVVAEGIESEQHVVFLRHHGCEQGQGYHFGKPMSAEQIAPRLPRSR